MAGITQNYMFDPAGDGIRFPIRQTAIVNPNGLLPRGVAAKLWARRHAAPDPFASAITSRYNASDVVPSAFAQFGRGSKADPLKLGRGRIGFRRIAQVIPSSSIYAPKYGGARRGKRRHRGGAIATVNAVINPGSY